MKKITKKAFLAAMKKGWRKLDYVAGSLFISKNGVYTEKHELAVKACALGAALYATKTEDTQDFFDALYANRERLAEDIAKASNEAGSKAAAIRAVSKIKWRTA